MVRHSIFGENFRSAAGLAFANANHGAATGDYILHALCSSHLLDHIVPT